MCLVGCLPDILDQVGYTPNLDLAKGYWQVPVAEEDLPLLPPRACTSLG